LQHTAFGAAGGIVRARLAIDFAFSCRAATIGRTVSDLARRKPWWRRTAARTLRAAYRVGSTLERLAGANGGDPPLPPLHLRMYYYRRPARDVFLRACHDARLELLSQGLRPDHRVLDIGSGIGNLAIGLRDYLTAPYRGFDVQAEAVEWCRRYLTPRYPLFTFDHIDLASVAYNAGGTGRAETFTFPLADASVDFVYLGSVFTHLLPAAVEQYVAEIGRLLAPGGRCVVSCFVLNDDRRDAVARGGAFLPFPVAHDSGVCRLHDAATPEAAVAFEEAFLRSTFERHALTVATVRHGQWWQGTQHDQDVFTLQRA
jgi:SAM-dependent methyltransferase